MFIGVTAEKLVGGLFTWETKFIQNFHKGEIYLIGENFVGENFYHPANISPLFPDEKFSSDIMNIFDLS